MIEIENVSAGYEKRRVLHGVSLTLQKGQVTTLIGANGSGKSTLLKVLLGFIPCMQGDIRINGIPAVQFSRAELARHIAYLPQGKNVPDITAGHMVLLGRFPYLSYPRRYRAKDIEMAYAAMEQMGIAGLWDRPMEKLSGGMRQKVYIAMALAQQADVIVMDEPTTYLDIGQQAKFAALVREISKAGKTVLLVLHDLPLALKISDQVAALSEGKIVFCGNVLEILSCGVIGQLYGVTVKSVQTEAGRQYFYEFCMEREDYR
ncbi:MAG: ABC transporter ATP-binding protein [Lachnospiraceae bacterium]|nr:ABC transporter ATP-binding protein [Lachnospiraceae bacterium]